MDENIFPSHLWMRRIWKANPIFNGRFGCKATLLTAANRQKMMFSPCYYLALWVEMVVHWWRQMRNTPCTVLYLVLSRFHIYQAAVFTSKRHNLPECIDFWHQYIHFKSLLIACMLFYIPLSFLSARRGIPINTRCCFEVNFEWHLSCMNILSPDDDDLTCKY